MWTLDGREFPAPLSDVRNEAAGNLITSAEDLLLLARSLLKADPRPLLSRASLNEIGVLRFGGSIDGFSSLLRIDPVKRWAAVAFSAKDETGFVLESLLDYASGKESVYKPAANPHLKVLDEFPGGLGAQAPPAIEAAYVGEYGTAGNKVYLLERGGKPHCLVDWFFLSELIPRGPNRFRFPPDARYGGEELRQLAKGITIGSVFFPKLPAPNRQFRITLQKPLAELKKVAAVSQAPAQPAALLKPNLVNLRTLSKALRFDIRYATANNFMGAAMYSQPGAWMQRPAAEAMLQASEWLKQFGYGLLIHDAYRPWRVTKMFWDATPVAQRNFVANPATGSRHNRGCAVDLSMYDLRDGKPVEMPSGYDEFSDRAYPNYPGGTSRQRWLRSLLRKAMEDRGFTVNDDEWWHFDYKDWQKYPVLNTSFEELGSR